MRARLTEKKSAADFLVNGAECTILDIVKDEAEESTVDAGSNVFLEYTLQGVWAHFDRCTSAPLGAKLAQELPSAFNDAAWINTTTAIEEQDSHVISDHVIFIPSVRRSFRRQIAGSWWEVTRRQLPLTSAL